MILVSHPDRSLFEHLQGLCQVIYGVLPEKQQTIWSQERFETLLILLVLYHDIAKATDYFQYKIIEIALKADTTFTKKYRTELESFIKKKNSRRKEMEEEDRLTNHGELGAYLIQAEFLEDALNLEQLILLMIIKKHHGNLQNFSTCNFCFPPTTPASVEQRNLLVRRFQALPMDSFVRCIQPIGRLKLEDPDIEVILSRFDKSLPVARILKALDKQKSVLPFLSTIYLYSLLLSADKGDVKLTDKHKVFERTPIRSTIIDDFKKSPNLETGKPIDKLRELAYQTVLNNLRDKPTQQFYTITLPTGLGKTFTAYKSALWLKENHYPHHRIVYCLPFTSIIDQNAGLLKAILKYSGYDDQLMTIHHYLTHLPEKDNNDVEIDTEEAEYVTEGWQNEIIVTTFVQLLESIFTNRNKRLRKFHNLANSIIILDEIQGIEAKYYPVLEKVFAKMAEVFNTVFLFVTATQPLILPNKTSKLAAPAGHPNAYYFFEQMDRIILNAKYLKEGEKELDAIADLIKDSAEAGNSVLGIFNTIKQSQAVYDTLKILLPEFNIRYLSAAMIPFCRKVILKKVKQDLDSKRPQVLISTQVVEAGVDIDFDIVFRDFAPMSSINQSAGRCNRNSLKGIGTVYLFDAGKSKRIYDQTLLSATREILDKHEDEIPESQIFHLNQTYFKLVKSRIQDNNDDALNILNHLYNLQFEELQKEFKVIKNNYPKWSVFIPLTNKARSLWKEYEDTRFIIDRWDRKKAVKKLMPAMLQYVVAIPEQYYTPSEEQRERPIIYEAEWRDMYDLEKGYKKKDEIISKIF